MFPAVALAEVSSFFELHRRAAQGTRLGTPHPLPRWYEERQRIHDEIYLHHARRKPGRC